jgi:hypothetical protein
MKKRIPIFIIALAGCFGVAHAQIEKGNILLGTDLGSGIAGTGSGSLFGVNFNLNKGSGWNIGISPKMGYFVKDHWMVGGVVNLGYNKSATVADGSASKTTVYGIQALTRYYAKNNQVNNLLNHGRFFAEANVGLAGVNVSGGNTTNGFVFGFGPGYSYFITQNVALEGLLKYNGLAGGGNTGYQSSLGLNFGMQVFLPSAKVKKLIHEPSRL